LELLSQVRLDARDELVEDIHCVIGYFDYERETFCVDPK
jgi:hypothetical protein